MIFEGLYLRVDDEVRPTGKDSERDRSHSLGKSVLAPPHEPFEDAGPGFRGHIDNEGLIYLAPSPRRSKGDVLRDICCEKAFA